MTQGNQAVGRPTKFDEGRLDGIRLMARRGFTDEEMALVLGVDESTLNRWKKKHPEFCKSLKEWKSHADGNVERSLYERALGYSHPDTKARWVETSELIDGQVVKSGRWVYAELTKHYPPDTTACIFWLKNRQPEHWRDRREMKVDTDDLDSLTDEELAALKLEIARLIAESE